MEYTLTTSEITLDCVAAVCIDSDIESRIEELTAKLARVKRESLRTNIANEIANQQRALEAFRPAYRACLENPLFVKEEV